MTVAPPHGAEQVAVLLDSPEIMGLIADLETTRWTGRRGYPIRAMVGLALVKNVYAIPTWSRTVRLVGEHAALRTALGAAPSIHAAYRFAVKLREHSAALADCLDRVLTGLREAIPGLHKPPSCQHGVWTFAGSDAKRGASKWRCPAGECQPASVWIKADRLHTLIPRTTDRWKTIYRTRGAVEREFGRLKHEWGLDPLRVRRLPRVRLHVDLTILARLTSALANARAIPLAA